MYVHSLILMKKIRNTFNRHFEWAALATGLLLMALMNPYADQGASWCLLEWAGVPFCPGEGLGHSIAFIFRGDWHSAMRANVLGPFAILVLVGRIGTLLKRNFMEKRLYNTTNGLFQIFRSEGSGK